MNRFQFTIRSSLLAVVGLLCAAVVGLASLESFRAWVQMGRAAKVAESNRIPDLLLTSAGNSAVERGVGNAALAARDPVDASTHAAIEAARAGDGKGFAVVADEVKSLAGEVAKVTSEISDQINGIQFAAGFAAGSSRAIARTISSINENAASIAAAVEQRNAATAELSRNVQEASTGTEEVARNAEGLNAASREPGVAAGRVHDAPGAPSWHARELAREVDVFIAKLGAA